MGSLTLLMQKIESHEFAARVNLASSFGGFLEAISSEPAVAELGKRIAENEEALRVLRHVIHLARIAGDNRYEHPHDSAIAAYLCILSNTKPEFATIAAQVAAYMQDGWWAGKLAQEILAAGMESTSSETRRQEVGTEARLAQTETAGTEKSVFIISLRDLVWKLDPLGASTQQDATSSEAKAFWIGNVGSYECMASSSGSNLSRSHP